MQSVSNIPTELLPDLGNRLITYARKFQLACILDSHRPQYSTLNGLYDNYEILGAFSTGNNSNRFINNFNDLAKITCENTNWYFGYLTYDLKNNIETLISANPDRLNWPPILLFMPEILVIREKMLIKVYCTDEYQPQQVITELLSIDSVYASLPELNLKPGMNKNEYIHRVKQIKERISRGDVYEVNFCQEFYNHAMTDPYEAFQSISEKTSSPFAAFVKYDNRFLLSASPERFLMKNGAKIISQPIKGTAPRGNNAEEDRQIRLELKENVKERTENIMIVDLVRNDLSKIADNHSVTVEELCGIYTFPHVHQMISTISASVHTSNNLRDILAATFPMGSMTGAPKISAMKIIEEFESVKRGLYSGSVGYIGPRMNFDFNVVIRSLQYNASNQYLSFMTGSAITELSDPEKEYEECLLKAYAVNKVPKRHYYAE